MISGLIPDLAYGEFSKRLHEQAAGKRIPVSGTIEITERCNLHCAHCYINRPADDREAQAAELTCAEWCGLIDRLADGGCLWLLLTGGEPFVRPDFLDIYTHARKKGIIVSVFTNGSLVTPQMADRLAEWPPFVVEITIYGSRAETHERVTGIPGSFKKTMEAVDMFMDRGLRLRLKTMALTLNKHELDEMRALAAKRGVQFRFDPLLNARIDGTNAPADYRIPAEQVVALDMEDEKRRDYWRDFCGTFASTPARRDYLYQCGAGMISFHVDSYGRLSPCMMDRVSHYDLRHGTFEEGWYGFMPRVLERKWTRAAPCRNCDLISLCGRCPGWAQIENGDPETVVDYLCRIAYLRSQAFGSAV